MSAKVNASSVLKDLVKQFGDEHTFIGSERSPESMIPYYIDTGSLTFNLALSGSMFKGLPGNLITGLAGEEATGKTFFTCAILRNFLLNNPDAMAIIFESEYAPYQSILADVPQNQYAIVRVNTIEEFRTKAFKFANGLEAVPVEKRPKVFFVLDSLGMLSSNKELGDIAEGVDKRDMTKTTLIKGAFRALTMKLGKLEVPMIVTNHVYAIIGAYVPTKEMGGGSGLKYAASSIVFLSKAKEKEDNIQVGSVITCLIKKGRLTREGVKIKCLLMHDTGLDRYYGIDELAETYGLLKKDGRSWIFPDGSKVTTKDVDANPAKYFTNEFLLQLDQLVAPKFCYGAHQTVIDEDGEGLVVEDEPFDHTEPDVVESAVKQMKKQLRGNKKAAGKRGRPKKV